MRMLVEIDDACIRGAGCTGEGSEALPRRADPRSIDDCLAGRRNKHERGAFGLWGRRKMDAVAYQAKMRREW